MIYALVNVEDARAFGPSITAIASHFYASVN